VLQGVDGFVVFELHIGPCIVGFVS
jgi:hypothetical protein